MIKGVSGIQMHTEIFKKYAYMHLNQNPLYASKSKPFICIISSPFPGLRPIGAERSGAGKEEGIVEEILLEKIKQRESTIAKIKG